MNGRNGDKSMNGEASRLSRGKFSYLESCLLIPEHNTVQ
jgi:hypothetical protein